MMSEIVNNSMKFSRYILEESKFIFFIVSDKVRNYISKGT